MKPLEKLLFDLNEIAKDIDEWHKDGYSIKLETIGHTRHFVEEEMIQFKLPVPYIEVFPDDHIGLSWPATRSSYTCLSFAANGLVTWTTIRDMQVRKGQFIVTDGIPDELKQILTTSQEG